MYLNQIFREIQYCYLFYSFCDSNDKYPVGNIDDCWDLKLSQKTKIFFDRLPLTTFVLNTEQRSKINN